MSGAPALAAAAPADPVRVLVVSETRFARDPAGVVRARTGVDGHAFWARYLAAFDEVLVAARTADVGGDAARPAVEGPGVRVVPLPDATGPWEHVRVRRRMARALAAGLADADAVCARVPGALGGLAWRLRGSRPFALEVVGDPHEALAPGTMRSAARGVARVLLARELAVMCRGATAVAYVTGRTLQRRYPTPAWSIGCSSADLGDEAFASDAELLQRARALARTGRGRPDDPWELLFVGSLAVPYKGLDVLLEALVRLARPDARSGVRGARSRGPGPAVRLTVLGDGRERPALERRAEALGLATRVRFLGQLPAGAAVREALDRADVLVVPSRTEGLPRVLLEAMARGLPAVASDVGGIPELLPVDRLVPPGDPDALADALARLCGAPEQMAIAMRRDRLLARRFHAAELGPRRAAFYGHLRAACAGPATPAAPTPAVGTAQPGLAAVRGGRA